MISMENVLHQQRLTREMRNTLKMVIFAYSYARQILYCCTIQGGCEWFWFAFACFHLLLSKTNSLFVSQH
jgi:hypothetical protein